MWYSYKLFLLFWSFFFKARFSLIIHRVTGPRKTVENISFSLLLSSSLFFVVVVLVVAIKVTRRRQIIKTSNKRSSVLQCLFVHRYHHPSLRRYEAVKITLLTREDVRLHIKKHHRRGTEEKR